MTCASTPNKVDALVIGGGIAGMQAATDLANQNIRVLLVEKDVSIGGKMIALSKVFPTLDCASCITSPKIAEVAHHPDIDILTLSEVTDVEKLENGRFSCRIVKHPRYVDEDACIGCRQCEYACPTLLPNEFEGGFGARKTAYIPHTNAYPQLATIDLENCAMCGKCIKVCPTDAIDFSQTDETVEVVAGTVVVATGFELTAQSRKTQYGGGTLPNVIDALQMERILAPHGPFGKVLRPSDGKIPDSIAYVQCAGSRDESIGVPYCSRVCCMYAIKQAMLLSGSLPFADITIYYMDIRAFGKNYEQFYQDAKAMGINFVAGKVAKIFEDSEGNPVLRVEKKEEGGHVAEDVHDLVILSQGIVPAWNPEMALPIHRDRYGFVKTIEEKISPARTEVDGIFAAGVAVAPKDIVDTIIEAGAAATRAANYLIRQEKTPVLTVVEAQGQEVAR